jgi:hypothetical protein
VQVGRDLGLGPVAVHEKLLLVVQELLARFGGELLVLGYMKMYQPGVSGAVMCTRRLTLHNRIDGASLLAEAAVNALGHVDV